MLPNESGEEQHLLNQDSCDLTHSSFGPDVREKLLISVEEIVGGFFVSPVLRV